MFFLFAAVYLFLGYLAAPDTLWKFEFFNVSNLDNRERIRYRFMQGLCLGWLIIPWWLIKSFLIFVALSY